MLLRCASRSRPSAPAKVGLRQMDQSLHRQRIDNWKPQRKLLPLFAAVVAAKNLAFVELDVPCALAAGAEENSIRCIGIEFDALDHAFARTREPPRELLPRRAAVGAAHDGAVGLRLTIEPARRRLLGNAEK